MKNVLVVAAHPDDEVLGCGVTMYHHVRNGDKVYIVFMSDGVSSRKSNRTEQEIEDRNKCAIESCRVIGAEPPFFLGFRDNCMDTVALLDVVQALENIIEDVRPSIVYTHHSGDLNIDHKVTHQAVMTACRPLPMSPIKEVYFFEVPSSTEYSLATPSEYFIPNYFVDISGEFDFKVKLLEIYKDEMRDFPNSRSIKGIKSLACYRGVSVGVSMAEAFTVGRLIK
jgi:N-acetylglucosamine malate deacetylase 1